MRRLASTIVLAVCLYSVAPAVAQEATPLVIGESTVVQSEILGEQRPIVVGLPAGYEAGSGSYPVVYVLDGPGHIHHTTGSIGHLAQNGRALPAIVVGIGNTDRTRDLTPRSDLDEERARFPTGGGAENFRRFLVDELRPFIDEHYRTNGGSILIGHSFGALFAIDTAIHEPESFNGYVAISPSLWWSGEKYVKAADELKADHPLFSGALYVAMGTEGPTMNPPFERFVEAIERNAPSDFVFGVGRFPDEDHGSIPLRATIAGLKSYFARIGDALDMRQVADASELERRYAQISESMGFEVQPSEQAVNQLGYRLLQGGQAERAQGIFAWNAKTYPQSANVYDSLGECLENLGKREDALANYTKAAELGARIGDPNLPVYRANAERMEKSLKAGG